MCSFNLCFYSLIKIPLKVETFVNKLAKPSSSFIFSSYVCFIDKNTEQKQTNEHLLKEIFITICINATHYE